MTDKIVVMTTCATAEESERIARLLVEARLAACVNMVPRVRSFYRWQGAIESSEEYLLVIKSSRELFGPLRAALEHAHSYEIPEAIALQIVEGAGNYMQWLESNLEKQGGD